jgi:PmbA protein
VDRLIDTARFALAQAKQAGAEFADVSVAKGRSLQVEIQESAVVSCDMHDGVSASVRCFVAGGCGIHVCHGLDRGDIVHAARAAVSAARAAGADPDFRGLPLPTPAGTVTGLYDESLADVSVSEASAFARLSIESALAIAPGANLSGAVSFVTSEGAFANSLGIAADESATSVSGEIMCVVREGENTGSFAEFDVARQRGDIDLAMVGEVAAKGALRYLPVRKMRGGEMPLIMGPLCASEIMGTVARAASAEPMQRGRSFLKDKVDKKIAPVCFTLEDDGRYPSGLHSSSRDGEGTPRRPLVIIDEGYLVNLIHNSYTAGKAGVKSTGHGSQFGGIAPTNLRPKLGTRTARELIETVQDGLYIESCMLSPNPVTGEISATVDWAMKIENGELAYPVTGIAISGSVLELLKDLQEVSSDFREEPGSIMPTMRFKKVNVAGTA